MNMWNFYWVKTALLTAPQPLLTDSSIPLLRHLRFHTLNPSNALLTMPFNLPWVYTDHQSPLILLFPYDFVHSYDRDLCGNPGRLSQGQSLFTYANRNVVNFFLRGDNLISHVAAALLFPMFGPARKPLGERRNVGVHV